MKTAYLCDIQKNVACTKEWCVKVGGPCLATLDEKYAVRDDKGHPVVADHEEMEAQADLYFKKNYLENLGKGRVSK